MHEVAVEQVARNLFRGMRRIGKRSYRDPEALAQAIRTLPPGEREAVEMLKLRELSLKEAAAASGRGQRPEGGGARAVKALRRVLAAGT